MVELIARSPCEGLLPVVAGAAELTELHPAAITSIMPGPGAEKAVSAALQAAHGLRFPAPGRATGRAGCRCIWTGLGQAFLVGPEPGSFDGAALTDQTDGWALMRLAGAAAQDVLARLVPVDLRAPVFRRGHTVRSLLFHVPASITRTGAQEFEIMVFRSMAHTAVEDLTRAMRSVAAQTQLSQTP